MSSTNQSPEYLSAQKRYYQAATDEEKLLALEEMISYMPKHKAGESMRANIRDRYKKLKESMERKRKQKKSSSKAGIKKEEMQAVLIGLAQSGKSSLLSCLTNAKPKISSYPYTTKQPMLGTLNYDNVLIQVVDMPAIESELFEPGIANTADLLIIIINKTSDLQAILPFIQRAYGERLIVVNKIDLLDESERRKISAFFSSKKLNFVMFSCKTEENILELKKKIWLSFGKIRVYTKEPGKKPDSQPVILNPQSIVKDVAEKVLHGLSKRVKETRVWGPSSKFSGQKVGLDHVLKDKDIVEFRTK